MDHDLNYILIHILARPGTQSESTASTYRNALRSIGITDLEGLTKLLPEEIDTLRLKPAEKNRIGALVAWFQHHPKPKAWKKLTTSEFDSWCLRHARRAQRRKNPRPSSSRSTRGRSRERALLQKEENSTSSSSADIVDDPDVETGLYCVSCSDREKQFLQRLIPAVVLFAAVLGVGVLFFQTLQTPYNYILVGVWLGIVVVGCCWPGSRKENDEDSMNEYDDASGFS